MTRSLYVADDVWSVLSNPQKSALWDCESYGDCLRESEFLSCVINVEMIKGDMDDLYIQFTDNDCESFTELGVIE